MSSEAVTISTDDRCQASSRHNDLVSDGGALDGAIGGPAGDRSPACIRFDCSRPEPTRTTSRKRIPVLRVPDESCYVRPEAGGYLFGFFDPDPLPIDLDEQAASFRTASVLPEHRLIHEAVERLRPLLPRLGELPIESYRQGMMTCTPDGKFVSGAHCRMTGGFGWRPAVGAPGSRRPAPWDAGLPAE